VDATTFYTGQYTVPVVYAIDLTTGTVRWKVNVGPDFPFPAYVHGIAVSGDIVYATVSRQREARFFQSAGVLVALDRRDGRVLWRYETPATDASHQLRGPPAIVGDVAAITDSEVGEVRLIDVRTGTLLTTILFDGNSVTGRFLDGATFYVGGSAGSALAIDLASRALRWSSYIGSTVRGFAVCGPYLYVNDFILRQQDKASGEFLAEVGVLGGEVFTSDLTSDGERVYVTGSTGVTAVICR
jgi:outer membrane protein assembly factor BamB